MKRELQYKSLFEVCWLHAGLLAALIWAFVGDFSARSKVLAVALFALTVIGVTVGYHRLVTHLSFKTGSVVRWLLLAAAALSLQGNVYDWVATHRQHHAYQDKPGLDPHSPYEYKGLKGVLWAHMGWILYPRNILRGFQVLDDLERDRAVMWHKRNYKWLVVSSFVLPTLIAGIDGLVLAGFARMVVMLHVTWAVNSVGHKWGTRPKDSLGRALAKARGMSRNNFIVGLLGGGEGWHGNHHWLPSCAYLGWRWWQIDVGKYVIRGLELMRLAWEVNKPPKNLKFPDRFIDGPALAGV